MIKQGDICIRAIEERDLREIYEWNSEIIRGRYQEFQFESFRQLKSKYEKEGFCSANFQMLKVEEGDKSLGLLYLYFHREGVAGVGLVLIPENCNKGYGTIILRLISDFIFGNYPIVRIEADTDVENIAGQRILEKSGFLREGILRKYRYHHGTYHDSYIYSIVK